MVSPGSNFLKILFKFEHWSTSCCLIQQQKIKFENIQLKNIKKLYIVLYLTVYWLGTSRLGILDTLFNADSNGISYHR